MAGLATLNFKAEQCCNCFLVRMRCTSPGAAARKAGSAKGACVCWPCHPEFQSRAMLQLFACTKDNCLLVQILKQSNAAIVCLYEGGARRQELLQEKLARQRELALVAEEAAERRRMAEAARQAGLSNKARKKEQAQVCMFVCVCPLLCLVWA